MSPARSPRMRAPLSGRWRSIAGHLLETSMLLALVTVVAAGVVADADLEPPPLPIHLGLRDVPALAAVAAFAVVRRRWQDIAGRLKRVPPFVVFAAAVCALGAAAHPDPDLGRALSAGMGLLVGVLFGWLGVPAHAFADALDGSDARPWRELHAGAALALLGSLPAAARGGVVLSAPTIAFGLLVLGRSLREDARDLLDGRASRGGSAARILLGFAICLLGAGLLVVTTALSLGYRPLR